MQPGCDCIVLHGMLSNAGALRKLADAIRRRGYHRRVLRHGIKSWVHRCIPQAFTVKTANEVSDEIIKSIKKGKINTPFDLVGHSNGGYVALHIAEILGNRYVRNVFTLGTPRGLYDNFQGFDSFSHQLTKKIQSRLFHFRGGVDRIPFGYNHDPGDGRYVFTFPDEGHSSLHDNADTNGVADLICFLAGKKDLNIFVDPSGTVHPWKHCRMDFIQNATRRIGHLSEYIVCDGIHDDQLKELEEAFLGKNRPRYFGSLKNLGDMLVSRLLGYLDIRARLRQIEASIQEEIRELRAYGKERSALLEQIEVENQLIQQKIMLFETKTKAAIEAFKAECSVDLENLDDALSACEAIAQGPRFGDREMILVNALLRNVLHFNLRINQKIQGKSQSLIS